MADFTMKTGIPYTVVAKAAPEPAFQLTVVTVCWNALTDLKPTVESVLRQKAKGSISIEHVVVDGASTDGTPEWLAEQLEAGNIEQYVSEPDRGIYDAMNKGINLARGCALAFLNAGDTYTDEDLAPCVLPIAEGRCAATGASARICGLPREEIFRPRYEMRYLTMPCCHQSYFAAACLYRENSGYDSAYYRCAADADFLFRTYNLHGSPVIVNAVVADFQAGGFSNDCHEQYRHEGLELLWRNWEQIQALCRQDKQYRDVFLSLVCNHCFCLQHRQRKHDRDISRELGNLAAMCNGATALTCNPAAKVALRFLGGVYLPRLIRDAPSPSWMRKALRLCQCACAPARDNPYMKHMPFPRITLSGCLR